MGLGPKLAHAVCGSGLLARRQRTAAATGLGRSAIWHGPRKDSVSASRPGRRPVRRPRCRRRSPSGRGRCVSRPSPNARRRARTAVESSAIAEMRADDVASRVDRDRTRPQGGRGAPAAARIQVRGPGTRRCRGRTRPPRRHSSMPTNREPRPAATRADPDHELTRFRKDRVRTLSVVQVPAPRSAAC